MPGGMRRVGKRKYRVRWGGKTTAKATSKKKAKSQLRLLRAVKHGWKPTRRRRGRRRTKRTRRARRK
jgi:hypothetical protein